MWFTIFCLFAVVACLWLRLRYQADRINLLGQRILRAEKAVYQLREYGVSALDHQVAEELNEAGYSLRTVKLPSGKQIEFSMYDNGFNEPAFDHGHSTLPAGAPVKDMSICPSCNKDKVYPVKWREASPTHWEVLLRCPECEWHNHDVPQEQRLFDQRTVDRFDDILDEKTGLDQANMSEEIDRFAEALKTDNVLPEDF